MKKLIAITLTLLLLIGILGACAANGATTSQTAESSAASSETPSVASSAAASSSEAASSSAQPEKKLNITWVNCSVGHPVYEIHRQGCEMAAADYDVNFTMVGPATGMDGAVEKYVSDFENAITQKVDGIIVTPWETKLLVPTLKKAQEAGIPVVCTGNDAADTSMRLAYIGTDNATYGKVAAEVLAKKTGGKANICIMMSLLDIPNQVAQKAAFEEAIKAYPDMKVIVTEADQAKMETATQKFEDVFNAYPEIDTVFMLEATGGPAAAKIAKQKGKNVTILDIDSVQETLDNINNGTEWATLAQNFYKQGYESVRYICDYYANNKDASKVPSMNDSGTVLITKDNIATYKDDMLKEIRKKGTPLQ